MAQVKVILGKRPKHFTHTVKFPMLEGGEGAIKASYIYRTRKEFGELVDARVQAAKDEAAQTSATSAADATADTAVPAQPKDFSMSDFLGGDNNKRATYIMEIMDDWNLDEPFGLDSVLQLCDELPGAARALVDDYAAAIREGHLGN